MVKPTPSPADPASREAVPERIPADILTILACVECRLGLEQVDCDPGEWPRVGGEQMAASCLRCVGCGAKYPITREGIPLLWTADLRQCMTEKSAEISPLAANVTVYNHVSDDYARYWRQDTRNARRMRSAAQDAVGVTDLAKTTEPFRHLDVGCGPGHVLQWLRDLPGTQFALDVSLVNLRNVRSRTRAFPVLGSADRLPFRDGAFNLVTESSVLHHIEHWTWAVREFARVCAQGGGVVLDCEPSRENKRWSKLAVWLFGLRWYPYKLMSYFSASKFWFRDTRTARMTFEAAEIHNKPNTGLPVDEMLGLLRDEGMNVKGVRSPDESFAPGARMSWQEMVLHSLSGHNPLNPIYGWFTVVARRGEL